MGWFWLYLKLLPPSGSYQKPFLVAESSLICDLPSVSAETYIPRLLTFSQVPLWWFTNQTLISDFRNDDFSDTDICEYISLGVWEEAIISSDLSVKVIPGINCTIIPVINICGGVCREGGAEVPKWPRTEVISGISCSIIPVINICGGVCRDCGAEVPQVAKDCSIIPVINICGGVCRDCGAEVPQVAKESLYLMKHLSRSHTTYKLDGGAEVPQVAKESLLDEASQQEPLPEQLNLKRELDLFSAVSLILSIMIGGGIFVSPSSALQRAGSVGEALIVWIVCGLLSLLGALAFAELSTVVPQSGAEYTYFRAAYSPLHKFWGPLPSFSFIWVVVLILRPAEGAIIILIFAEYVYQPVANIFDPQLCPLYQEYIKKIIALLALDKAFFGIGLVMLKELVDGVKWTFGQPAVKS
ncbi:hypothetical protein J6590_080222 [Homalodisca vitripennis]|nr:hypothetical protein J6590_080222 [Homalodisca vitripennis]